MKNLKLISIIILGIIILNSCNKNEISSELNENNNACKSGIITFESINDYEIAKKLTLNSTSIEKRKAWEESNGITSFGSYCDELYENLNIDDFKSTDEIRIFVSNNSEYFQLIEDDKGEFTLETKLFSSPYRYIINMEQMFQIENKIYKVFENGIASTSIENIELLRVADKFTIIKFAENPNIDFKYNEQDIENLKSANVWCGNNTREVRSTNGKDRTYFKLVLEQSTGVWGSAADVFCFIRPYKRTWGIWFFCGRHISWDIDVSIFGKTSTGWTTKTDHASSTYDGSVVQGTIAFTTTPGTTIYNYNYIHAWADTPSTSPARIVCN